MCFVVLSHFVRTQSHAFLGHNYCTLTHIFMDNFRMVFVILLLLQILMNVEIARQTNANRQRGGFRMKEKEQRIVSVLFDSFQTNEIVCERKLNNHARRTHSESSPMTTTTPPPPPLHKSECKKWQHPNNNNNNNNNIKSIPCIGIRHTHIP